MFSKDDLVSNMPAALIMPRWARNLGVNMPSPFWKGTSSTVYVDKSQCRLDSPMATLIGVTEDGKVRCFHGLGHCL